MRTLRILVFAPFMALSACVTAFNGETQSLTAQERFPIAVTPDTVALEIDIQPGQRNLSASDVAKIKAFAVEYKYRGHGPMKLAAPNGARNSASASRLAAQASWALSEAGLASAEIERGSYVPASSMEAAPLRLSFTRYIASASDCGLWDDNMAYAPRNTPNRNFGCATQHNLAAIIEDPRDLIEPRGMGPAYVDRRSKVLETYREGEVTASERSENESGAVSDAVE